MIWLYIFVFKPLIYLMLLKMQEFLLNLFLWICVKFNVKLTILEKKITRTFTKLFKMSQGIWKCFRLPFKVTYSTIFFFKAFPSSQNNSYINFFGEFLLSPLKVVNTNLTIFMKIRNRRGFLTSPWSYL